LCGFGLGALGAVTATDLVSLRAVAHAIDLPLLSGVVIMLREAMPTSVAHAVEPAAAVAGAGIAAMTALSGAPRTLGLVRAAASGLS
jgi:hypothetical protein